MNKKSMAVVIAAFVMFTSLCFPIPAVYAAEIDPIADAATEPSPDSQTEEPSETPEQDAEADPSGTDSHEREQEPTITEVPTEPDTTAPQTEPPVTEDATVPEGSEPEREPQTDPPDAGTEQPSTAPKAEPRTSPTETDPATQSSLPHTFEDLQALLDEGGTVALGASITIPAGETLTVSGASIQVIEYGLRVEGVLEMEEGAAITGEGVAQPVVEVAAGGRLRVYGSDFDRSPCIAAEGANGRGLVLRAGFAEYYVSPGSFMRVAANGAGAVAIESEAPLELNRNFIEALGGTGIVCSEEVKLFLCQINAGTSAVTAPGFTADTCVLSPSGDSGGTFIQRKIAEVTDSRTFVKQGEPIPEHLGAALSQMSVRLRAEGQADVGEILNATVEIPNIDTSVPGVYPLSVILDDCWSAFDLVPDGKILYAIEVYDPSVPCFWRVGSSFGMDYVDYFFDGDPSVWTLWRSDDEGENWYDYTAETEHWGEVISAHFYERPEHPVLLAWEAEGIGESKVLRVTWDEYGNVSGDLGGDRGGGGRGENELPPTPPGDDPRADPPPTDPGNDPPGDSGDSTSDTPTPTPEPPPDDSGSDTPTVPAPQPANPGNGASDTPTPTPETPSPDSGSNPPTNPSPTPQTTNPSGGAPVSPSPAPTRTAPPTGSGNDAPVSPAPAEASDDRGVTVSGERLAAMIEANPVSVPFWGDELRVLLPASWLKSLALRGTDSFTVDVWQPDEKSVAVALSMNGTAITQRLDEAFLLSLPWDGGPVSCMSEDGETTDAVLAHGRAEFALFETGAYTLEEKTEDTPSENMTIAVTTGDAAPPPPKPAALSAPKPEAQSGTDGWTQALVIGGAVSAGAVAGFLRKRLVKRS